jgi:Flp pilus assembly pilin Flp
MERMAHHRSTTVARAHDELGGAAVEYGLLASLVAGVVAGTVALLGDQVLTFFTSVVGAF